MTVKKNVRLIDIAQRLDLTANTVSRALRDKSDIGEETKELVRKTASEMGYIPNTIASSLRKGSSKTIAIVFDNLINPYFMIMADKIHRKLEPLNYATMIFAGSNGRLGSKQLIPIVSRKVDAIITFLEPTKKTLELLNKNDIPIILVGRVNQSLKVDSISTKDYEGAYQIGKLFVSKGSKECGYIGAPISVECSQRRMSGFKQGIIDSGGTVSDQNLRYMNDELIIEDVECLLKQNVDSIFCFNDMMALEVYSLLQNKGIKVPEEVKVAGFDNLRKEFTIPINLTTIDTDKDGIIDLAVDTLLTKIKSKSELSIPRYINFDVQLIEGDTT
ncbi:LacI family DNA-binding transcriptional regulator [Candidatus Izemoplasma sp. B36]|uniref:LacI family DNA-binding transcriptional regulator n=1 Tax=Candidatus Izemoplasma sp. B36 TaxID=3242468 RepID=UPI0035573E89